MSPDSDKTASDKPGVIHFLTMCKASLMPEPIATSTYCTGIGRIKGPWREMFFQYPDTLYDLNRAIAIGSMVLDWEEGT